MTLGNDPQPLTRRQARELAERQAQSSTDRHGRPPVEKNVAQSSKNPAQASKNPAKTVPKSVAKPVGVSAVPTPVTTVHALTRREMRARDTAAHPASDDAASPASAEAESPASEPVAAASPVPPSTDPAAPARPPMGRPSAVRPSPVRPPVPVAVDESVPIPPVPANHGRSADARDSGPTPAPFDASRLPGLHPPVGHWSVDTDDDDLPGDGRLEPFDHLMGRGTGAGGIPTTTNALILPSIPNQGTTSGPLADSGEILITGSFDLPRSLGSTGQLPNHFDSSEMDHMLDQFDDDGAPGAAAPVSASRAVSTHASTRNVMAAPKRRMPSLPAVLAITAAVLALGVLALFVGGYLLNIF